MDSPLKPGGVVTTDIPQSKLTGADIAQPYQMFARALDDAGQSTEKIAVSMAEQAGTKAVTRDEQGNIQVERAPIFGAAGEAYARAVKVAALTEYEGQAERDDVTLRQKFRDDPAGYLEAAQAYKRDQVQKLATAAGPEAGLALGRSLERVTTQTWKGLLNEKESLDLQRANNSITAGVTSASDDALALARQGVALDDPSMQAKIDKYTTLLDEKLKNPRLAYTQEQHDLDIETFKGQLAGARNLYHVDQVYKTDGYQAAVEAAKDVLTNEGYKLTPAQRQAFYSHAMSEIRANEAIRRQDIGEARAAHQELSVAARLGSPVTPDQVESVANAYRSVGYPAGVARLYAEFAHKDLHDDFGRQPLSQQTQELNTIKGAAAAKQAYQFFLGKGYSPEASAGIVGNLVHESGLNPETIHDQGTGLGIAGFRLERREALRQFAAARGKPATDLQTQLEFVDQELRTTEAGTRAKLTAARTPEEAAAAFINYERPQGYDPNNLAAAHGYQNRVGLARSIFKGEASDGSGGPGVQSWLISNRQASVDDAATKAWKQVWTDWSAGKGGAPPADRVNEIISAARAAGNVDLLARIGHDMDVIDKVQRMSQLPVPDQVALENELRRRQAGGEADAGAELIEKQLSARTAAIQKGIQENPIGTTLANFPDKFKTPAPLDFSSSEALAGGLKMRRQISEFAADTWHTGRLPMLDKADVAQVTAALQGPQGGQVMATLSAATTPDEMKTLLGTKDFADSVTGMMGSKDPAKMSAAMGAVDKLWRDNATDAETTLGKAAITRLQAWQGLQGAFNSAEIAERLNASDDPSTLKAREAARDDAEKETKSLTPGDMAYKLGTGWPGIGRLTGSTPAAPFDSIKGGELVADFKATYTALRTYGVDADKASDLAVQRLQSTWGVSGAAGNQVMKLPPEKYYPSIGGSQEWLQQDLQAWVTGKLGARFGAGGRSLEAGIGTAGAEPNWTVQGLIADGQTQGEISGGRPPSYRVAVQKADGTLSILDGRVGFDPTDHIQRYGADLETRRQAADWLNRGQFSNAGPMP